MKTMISFLCLLLTLITKAQFNNTYDVNMNADYLEPTFCIMTSDMGSASLSYGLDAPSTPRTDYLILTKHDAAGNVMFNKRLDPPATPTDGFIEAKALLETPDLGILIAGYMYDMSNTYMQPILYKVDVNGNLLWTQIYYVNTTYIIGAQFNKISLARVDDDKDENYFIVAAGNSDANPANNVATNVIKVDANGNMLWSKKYYDVNPNPYTTLREFPGDIAFSKADKMYMITGWRQQWITFQEDRMFFFGIDRDGNMMTNFKSITAQGYPFNQDMVWDPFKKVFAVTFTHGNSGYIPGIASGIGLVTIDAGLNIYLRYFYWHKDGLENYGRSISIDANGNYIIGCFIYDQTLGRRNPAWLKVNAGGQPLSFKRYNILDDVIFGHHCNAINPGTGDQEYVLIAEHNNDLRVIRTDMNGDACGSVKYKPLAKEFLPKEKVYKYDFKQSGNYRAYTAVEISIAPNYRLCSPPGTSYRTRQNGSVSISENNAETGLQLYPTVLSASDARLNLVNNYETELTMQIRNIAGQLVLSLPVMQGNNTLSLSENTTLAEGVYLATISDANGILMASKKLLVTK